MKWAVASMALACGASALGCDAIVVDMSPDQKEIGGDFVGSNGASGGGSIPSTALAWKGSDTSTPILSGGPDALVLSWTSFPQATCGLALPFDVPAPCLDQSQLVLTIPPQLARPARISLDDPRVLFHTVTHFADCSGGGGEGMMPGGLLEIVSSDANALTVSLTDVHNGSFDGEHQVQRCGTPLPPFVPTAAVAVAGSALSENPSTGTGPADPDALYVFLGTSPGTCAEPRPIVDCTQNSQMVLSLPAALQVPGEVPLTDPQLGATYTSPYELCAANAPSGGTITILDASATAITVRVLGSGWAALDGDYDVAICP